MKTYIIKIITHCTLFFLLFNIFTSVINASSLENISTPETSIINESSDSGSSNNENTTISESSDNDEITELKDQDNTNPGAENGNLHQDDNVSVSINSGTGDINKDSRDLGSKNSKTGTINQDNSDSVSTHNNDITISGLLDDTDNKIKRLKRETLDNTRSNVEVKVSPTKGYILENFIDKNFGFYVGLSVSSNTQLDKDFKMKITIPNTEGYFNKDSFKPGTVNSMKGKATVKEEGNNIVIEADFKAIGSLDTELPIIFYPQENTDGSIVIPEGYKLPLTIEIFDNQGKILQTKENDDFSFKIGDLSLKKDYKGYEEVEEGGEWIKAKFLFDVSFAHKAPLGNITIIDTLPEGAVFFEKDQETPSSWEKGPGENEVQYIKNGENTSSLKKIPLFLRFKKESQESQELPKLTNTAHAEAGENKKNDASVEFTLQEDDDEDDNNDDDKDSENANGFMSNGNTWNDSNKKFTNFIINPYFKDEKHVINNEVEIENIHKLNDGKEKEIIFDKIIEILPPGMEYTEGSFKITFGEPINLVSPKDGQPEIISNFKNTGKTAIVYKLPNILVNSGNNIQKNITFEYTYEVTITPSLKEGVSKIDSYVSWEDEDIEHNDKEILTDITDPYGNNIPFSVGYIDKDGFLNTGDSDTKLNKEYEYLPQYINFIWSEESITTSWGKGDKNNDYVTDTAIGNLGSEGNKKIKIKNNSDKEISNLTIIDILPKIGDKQLTQIEGTTNYNKRGSEFPLKLSGPIELDNEDKGKYTIYYTTEEYNFVNPNLTEFANKNIWTTKESDFKGDYKKVTAIKIVLNPGSILEGNKEVEFELPIIFPSEEKYLWKKAVNSIATTKNPSLGDFRESNNTVFQIDGYKVEGYIFNDKNRNGTYDNGEGIKGRKVELRNTNGIKIAEIETDEKGYYSFILKDIGNYKIYTEKNSGEEIINKGANDNQKASHIDKNGETDAFELNNTNKKIIKNAGFIIKDVTEVSVTKKADKEKVKPGDTFTYTITVKNTGNTKWTGKIEDKLPESVTFVSASNGASFDKNTNTVSKAGITLEPSKDIEFTITVKVNNGITGEIQNVATATGNNPDKPESPENPIVPTPSNPEKTPIDNQTQVDVTKKADKEKVKPGDTFTYTITVKNTGNTKWTGKIEDKLPESVSFVSASNGASFDKNTNTVSKAGITLEPSKDIEFIITVKVIEHTTGEIENVATATGNNPDTPTNDPKDATNDPTKPGYDPNKPTYDPTKPENPIVPTPSNPEKTPIDNSSNSGSGGGGKSFTPSGNDSTPIIPSGTGNIVKPEPIKDTSTNTGKIDKIIPSPISPDKDFEDTIKNNPRYSCYVPTDYYFPDIDDKTFGKYLHSLAYYSIMTGFKDGYIKPKNNITRAEYLKVLFRALCIDYKNTDTSTVPFKDIKENFAKTWEAQVVAKALELGMIDGKKKNFRATDSVTRAEAMKLFMIASGEEVDSSIKTSTYNDVNGWMIPYVEKALELGMIKKGKKFRSNHPITRGENAKTMYNFIVQDKES